MKIQEILLERIEDIRQIVSKYKDDPSVYIHFTNLPKLGIYPKASYKETPIGIYAYPVYHIWNDILNNTIPYASNRQYFILFRIKEGNYLNFDNYTQEQYQEDLQKIKKTIIKYDNTYKLLDYKMNMYIKYYSLNKDIYNITKRLAELINKYRAHIIWSKILISLGYDGIIDNGYGVIYTSEPFQSVFFHINKLKLVGIYINKVKNIHDADIDTNEKYKEDMDYEFFEYHKHDHVLDNKIVDLILYGKSNNLIISNKSKINVDTIQYFYKWLSTKEHLYLYKKYNWKEIFAKSKFLNDKIKRNAIGLYDIMKNNAFEKNKLYNSK